MSDMAKMTNEELAAALTECSCDTCAEAARRLREQPEYKSEGTLWAFNCWAHREPNGYYRVVLVGAITGERRESVGYHPLWELIRLLATTNESKEAANG